MDWVPVIMLCPLISQLNISCLNITTWPPHGVYLEHVLEKKRKWKIKRLKSVQILASARNNTSVFTDELLRLQRLISEVSSSTGMKMWIVWVLRDSNVRSSRWTTGPLSISWESAQHSAGSNSWQVTQRLTSHWSDCRCLRTGQVSAGKLQRW